MASDENVLHRGTRRDIQGLRAVAVLSVVLAHAGVSGLSGGFVGVDVFFVISGFLITGLLVAGMRSGHRALRDFFARRARRILPAATAVVLATVSAAAILLNPVRASDAFWDGIWASAFLANVKFAKEGTDYFAIGTPPSLLQHFWSLAVEEQFYLGWPLLIALVLVGFRWRARRLRCSTQTLFWVLVVVSLASFAFCLSYTQRSPTGASFSTPARIWELGIGGLLALQVPALAKLPAGLRTVASWAGLLAITVAVVTFDAATLYPGKAALLPVLGAALILGGGVGGPSGGVEAVLGRQPLRWIGDVSYSLYLWHWPVLQIAEQRSGHPLSMLVKAELIVAAIALAGLSYRFIENPIRNAQWAEKPQRALVLWPLAVTLVMLTSWIGPLTAEPLVAPTAVTTAAFSAKPGESAAGDLSTSVERLVETAAKSTVTGEKVPAGLQPPITSLGRDVFETSCYSGTGQVQVQQCATGDVAATPSMLLFGDSHAGMWLPALDVIGRRRHVKVNYLVKSGCTPMTVHLWFANQGIVRDCDAWRASAIKAIQASTADLVILGSFAYQANLADNSANNVPAEQSAQLWQAGVVSTVKAISRPGRRVVVLGDPQPMPALPVDCLSRQNAKTADCAGKQDNYHFKWGLVTQDAARASQAGFVDVLPWFCWAKVCPMAIGGRIAFKDDNHVSRTYMLTLSGVLDAALFPKA